MCNTFVNDVNRVTMFVVLLIVPRDIVPLSGSTQPQTSTVLSGRVRPSNIIDSGQNIGESLFPLTYEPFAGVRRWLWHQFCQHVDVDKCVRMSRVWGRCQLRRARSVG